jgi:hypothetical protein
MVAEQFDYHSGGTRCLLTETFFEVVIRKANGYLYGVAVFSIQKVLNQ